MRPMKTMNPLLSQGLPVMVVGILCLISWRAGYQPRAQVYRRDTRQVEAFSKRVSQWDAQLRQAGGEAAWRAQTQQRLAVVKARFPQQTQLPQLINAMVELLKAGDLKLLNVAQGNVELLQDASAPLLIDGAPCYRLPITVAAEGHYPALMSAIEQLSSETFPAIVTVEHLALRRKSSVDATLEATLGFSLYISGGSSTAAPQT